MVQCCLIGWILIIFQQDEPIKSKTMFLLISLNILQVQAGATSKYMYVSLLRGIKYSVLLSKSVAVLKKTEE